MHPLARKISIKKGCCFTLNSTVWKMNTDGMSHNFKALHEEGLDAMVARVEIDFKTSLSSGDEFLVKLNIDRDGPKLIFHEDIYRLSDNKLCAKGKVYTICLKDGRLTKGEIFDELFAEYLN